GRLGRFEDAVINFDKAIDLDEKYSEAWYNRGLALEALKRYEEAVGSYDRALKINPQDRMAWYSRDFLSNGWKGGRTQ
ncbi:MAG: tetratricopeptide repeat protein, partial [Thermoplasmata archaeon]